MKISEELLIWIISLISSVVIFVVVSNIVFLFVFKERLYPQIKIDQVEVGGLTYDEAEKLLQKKYDQPISYQVNLKVSQVMVASESSQLGLKRNYREVLNQAYNFGRVGFPLKKAKILLQTLIDEPTYETSLTYDQDQLEQFVSLLKKEIDYPAKEAVAQLKYSGSPQSLVVDPGKNGRELLVAATLDLIKDEVGHAATISAKVASISAQLDEQQVEAAQERAAALVGKRLLFQTEAVRLELNDQKLISFLAFPNGYQKTELSALIESWTDLVNRPAQDAVFEYDPQTYIVSQFKPDRPGLELNQEETLKIIKSTIEELITNQAALKTQEVPVGLGEEKDLIFELPVQTTEASMTLAETNDLGIRERIGMGESEYDHSIANRIHNVKITADKISDTIIAPGEKFSFNQTLGEVSSRTGYRSAYVIRNGRTELGDGGGVCQVSTTVFRAALDAGLDITRRLPHSYRVSYYELNSKPGVDATVYAGNVDLRFINNTDHHILLHSEANSEELYMKVELYGTSDGRTTEIVDHQVWGYSSPPPPQYYPDPTLPAGATKQIDWAVAGAKAKFTHIIRNPAGEIIHEKTYYSNYQPWSAKYLVGE